MSYGLVGSLGAVASGASGASVTPAYGQSPTANNLLWLWVASFQSGTLPAAPSGWNLGVQTKDSLSRVAGSLFWRVATGGDAAPTIAGISGAIIDAMLGEFSGNATASLLDQVGHNSETTTTTPLVATAAGVDVAAGELVVSVSATRYSAAATASNVDTLNNGATTTSVSNNGSSAQNHYVFSWGVTTGNGVADSVSSALTTTNLLSVANVLASAKLGGAPTPPVSHFRGILAFG